MVHLQPLYDYILRRVSCSLSCMFGTLMQKLICWCCENCM